MNKSTKIIIIAAAGCILLGLIAGAAAFAIVGGNWSRLGTDGDYVQRTEVFDADQVTSLLASDVSNDIEVSVSEDGRYHVTCWENKNEQYDIALKDGHLSVRYQKKSRSWNIGFNFDVSDHDLRIEVPRDCAAAAISAISGRIKIDPDDRVLIVNGDLSLSTASGDISANGVDVHGNLLCSAISGKIKLDGIGGTGATLSSTSGKIELENCQLSRGSVQGSGVTVSSTSGGVTAEGLSCMYLSVSSASGDCRLKDVQVFGPAKLESASGKLKFEKLKCQGLSANSASGEVYGSLVGVDRWSFDCRSTSGDIDLPRGNGEYLCRIDTVSGDIEITLVD